MVRSGRSFPCSNGEETNQNNQLNSRSTRRVGRASFDPVRVLRQQDRRPHHCPVEEDRGTQGSCPQVSLLLPTVFLYSLKTVDLFGNKTIRSGRPVDDTSGGRRSLLRDGVDGVRQKRRRPRGAWPALFERAGEATLGHCRASSQVRGVKHRKRITTNGRATRP